MGAPIGTPEGDKFDVLVTLVDHCKLEDPSSKSSACCYFSRVIGLVLLAKFVGYAKDADLLKLLCVAGITQMLRNLAAGCGTAVDRLDKPCDVML